MRASRRAGGALSCAALAIGCAAAAWDADAWARSRPELAGRTVGRLGDVTPYLIAADDTLHLFLCRWPLDAPLRVSLPADANPDERRLLAQALHAWERVVGLRFEVVETEAPLRLRFRDDEGEGARTAAECRVAPPFDAEGPLDAVLVDAEIELRRDERDAWGRPRELSAAEFLGMAAHELGHALGLQGHATRGASVLRREPAAVRRVGERLLAGEVLAEDAGAALYALSSGARVGQRALPSGATRAVDAMGARARARGRSTADLRLGDTALRVSWGPDPDLVYHLKDPAKLSAGKIDFLDAMVPTIRGRPGAGRHPMSGSNSRAFASRFAAGATSPSVFRTNERRWAISASRGSRL
jgi:hypothetical protein